MKDQNLKVFGLILMLIGMFGILLFMNVRTIGNVIKVVEINEGYEESLNPLEDSVFEFSKIEEVIVRGGEKKTISLSVKNIGNNFLNDCKLIGQGDISSWIYSGQTKGLAAGEKIDFIFDINVPEGIVTGKYLSVLMLKCEEDFGSIEFEVSVLESLSELRVLGVSETNGILNASYIFDNGDFIGDKMAVDIWVKDSDNIEVKRMRDIFGINRDGLIERTVFIDLREANVESGVYYVYFALSSNLDNYVKESLLIGKSVGTGNAIFEVVDGKGFPYAIFLLVISLGAFFIFKSHRKSVQEMHEDGVKSDVSSSS
jgi:hypothetical protein